MKTQVPRPALVGSTTHPSSSALDVKNVGASSCKSAIKVEPKIVSNYEKLTADKEVRVPDTYYHVALLPLKGRLEHALERHEEGDTPKND